MAMASPRVHASGALYAEILVVALLIVVAALALTITVDGPTLVNTFTVGTDPAAGIYP